MMHRLLLSLLCIPWSLASTAPISSDTHASPSDGHHVTIPEIAHPQEETPQWWYRSGAAKAAANGAIDGNAKNVILFLADGMSLPTVAAARILDGQRRGQPGEENLLSWERFPYTAFSKTYTVDSQTPDSAGTMTAITTGVKTHMGAIGVSAGRRNDCRNSLDKQRLTWLELADSAAMSTGIVTTARLTDATPAATYAHVPDRRWENDVTLPAAAARQGCRDIARQMVSAPFGQGPQVMLGGGRSHFLPVTEQDPEYPQDTGLRRDHRNLIEDWRRLHPHGHYVWNRGQFEAAADAPALLGLFESGHMQYEHDRNKSENGEPSLAEMTRAAIKILSRNPNGYVLMVESARIDHAHHAGNAYRALDETIALSEAVQTALETAVLEDTLIIVTADHSHTLNFVGYPARGNPILGKVRGRGSFDGASRRLARDLAGHAYTTLSYANGPGYTGRSDAQPRGVKRFEHRPSRFESVSHRPDLDTVDTESPDYLQEALVPLSAESHGGDDVGIWAQGPGSSAIRGTVEQNTIYHFIVQATPRLRERLCTAGTCDDRGVPVELPKWQDFIRNGGDP
ncbi:MAG: alkaline phosphatase [Xanthomonadaceae bacterium]|jgi:alkaline phosphatase|nr:alkaline phosphatase [Xanthomonadaceae bacterium]